MSEETITEHLTPQEQEFLNYVQKIRSCSKDGYDEALEYCRKMYYDMGTGVPFDVYKSKIDLGLSLLKNTRYNKYIPSGEQLLSLYLHARRQACIACAGGGKTVTMIAMIIFVQAIFNIDQNDVLACTYTKAGAENMKARYDSIRKELDSEYNVKFMTIHAFCRQVAESIQPWRLITLEQPLTSMEWDEELNDYEETTTSLQDLIRPCINMYAPSKGVSDKQILSAITFITERNITTEEDFKQNNQYKDFPLTLETVNKINSIYKTNKASKRVFDYTDSLVLTLDYLKSVNNINDIITLPRVYSLLRKRLICTDEYQDTTPLQVSIIDEILRINPDARHMIIGDDDQSIFSFQGSDVGYIINFAKRYMYDGVAISYLTENRRSSEAIVNVCNKFISQNRFRTVKSMTAMKNIEGHVTYLKPDEKNASLVFKSYILNRVKDLQAQGKDLNNLAIIYREHKQATPYLLEFIKNKIPFYCASMSSADVYPCSTETVNNVLLILKLFLQPKNEYFIEKCLPLVVPYMKHATAKEIANRVASNKNAKVLACLKQNPNNNYIVSKMINIFEDIRTSTDCDIILPQVLSLYYDAKIEPQLKSKKKTDETKSAALDEYKISTEYLKMYTNMTIQDFILAHEKTVDWVNENSKKYDGTVFKTYFTAKGLEYNEVIILPVSDAISPKECILYGSTEKNKQAYIEEERRLLYVAMSRAISKLTIFLRDDTSKFCKEVMAIVPPTGINYFPNKDDENISNSGPNLGGAKWQ